ncbi:hypothetical protein SEA_HEXBUG_48 [Gordonia phage Hexbug]|nr:hypothetical protein SEA_ORLA_48 [Gordonia phage Orla]UVK62962.1 hypothetical protein SEA_HEXBUG_48 [Gordonia phage Hexbug]
MNDFWQAITDELIYLAAQAKQGTPHEQHGSNWSFKEGVLYCGCGDVLVDPNKEGV